MEARAVCLIAVIAVWQLQGQQPSAPLQRPYGPANLLVSPDGAHALFGNDRAAQLFLEDTRTHQRVEVIKATIQTLTLAWSPDSAAFIVNDRAVSDLEFAYIYDAKRLDRLDLRSRILAADPEAARFVPGKGTAPHSYFHAIRWLNAKQVEVQLQGHTDGTWNGTSGRPGDCFDLRYRVGRDGVVHKLSQRVSPIDDKKGCGLLGDI
jgi:hypothetical protein